ncbi:MAG: site-2 protease family protein [Acidimicrobiales bacterium]
MNDTVRLGRIGGVVVGLNWTLLVVVALLAYGLASSSFPSYAAGYPAVSYAVASGTSERVWLLCVLLHELGHAFVARRAGLAVGGITLSWMGGVTRIEGDAARPRAELAIAAVGPAVSLALGGLLWVARLSVQHSSVHRLMAAALGWLAVINVVLAVFNLFPAAPLDGGRVLHALAWSATGDRLRATRIASRAGVVLGAAVIGFGVVEGYRGSRSANGLFLMLLGWWLLSAARAEEASANAHSALEGLKVADLMRPVGAGPGWLTIDAFIEHHAGARPGWVWLLEGWESGYQGVVSGDALLAVPLQRRAVLRPLDLGLPVAAAAGASPTEDLLDVLARTEGKQVVSGTDSGSTVCTVLSIDV